MEQDTPRNFKFINFGVELEIQINENNQALCPKCNKNFKQLLQHIKKSTECKNGLDFENFSLKYKYMIYMTNTVRQLWWMNTW